MQLFDEDQEKSHGEDADLRFDRDNESTTAETGKKMPEKGAPADKNISPSDITPLTDEEKIPKLGEQDQKK